MLTGSREMPGPHSATAPPSPGDTTKYPLVQQSPRLLACEAIDCTSHGSHSSGHKQDAFP